MPDFTPYEAYACHVKIGYFNKTLQTEFTWVVSVRKFVFGNATKVLNKTDDRILIKIQAALEDAIDLGHRNILNHKLGISKHRSLSLSLLLG